MIPPGINRFGFQGQWGIDWELYAFAEGTHQAHIGHWGHDWNFVRERSEFRVAQSREFVEEQYLLRIRATGSFRTLLIPYRKGQRPANLQVSEVNGNITVSTDTETNVIGTTSYRYNGPSRQVLSELSSDTVIDFGIELSGGPTETVMTPGRFIVTAQGTPGLRRIKVPGNWIPEPPLVRVGDEFQLNLTGSGSVTGVATIPNHAPEIQPIPDQIVLEGTPVSLQIEAIDLEGVAQTLAYTVDTAPEGLMVDKTSGLLTWTPSDAQGPGQHKVTVRVTDSGESPLSAVVIFGIQVLDVNSPPIIDPIGNVSVDEGVLLNVTPSVTDPDIPVNKLTFRLGAGAPVGARIDSITGGITWTPSEAQGGASYNISVTATDDGRPSKSDTKVITVMVNEVNNTPTIALIENQSAAESVAFTYALQASDSDLPPNSLTWTLGTGAPAGMKIDRSTAVISWTPEETQGGLTLPVTITVTDSGMPPLSDTMSFTITVAEQNAAPQLSAISDQIVDEEKELTFTVTATDSDLPAQKLALSLVPGSMIVPVSPVGLATDGVRAPGSERRALLGLGDDSSTVLSDARRFGVALLNLPSASNIPEGATIDPVTGVFRWTPTEAQGPGKYPITVRVTDDGTPPLSAEQTFTVTVNEVNSAPKLSVASDQSIEVGRELTFTATAADSDLPANTLVFAMNAGAPDGARITSAGAFTWTPTDGQGGASYPIVITAADDGSPSLSDSKSFNVLVTAVARQEIRVTGASVSGDGKFSFTWSAQAGRSYQVQFKNDLADAEWTNIEPVVTPVADNATFTASISEAAQRYYRVVNTP